MIYVADLGFGNTGSIFRFLESINEKFVYAAVDEIINITEGVILLPGNGHWSSYLQDKRLVTYLRKMPDQVGLIGICGGFQVMFKSSDEGPETGLAVCNGRVERLKSNIFPNVGHKTVSDGNDYYFLNCFGAPLIDMPGEFTTYEIEERDYLAAWQYKNFAGFQFHPEVSGNSGRRIFQEYFEKIKLKTSID